MEEVAPTVEVSPPKEKEEEIEIGGNKANKAVEALVPDEIAAEVGVKKANGAYQETKKGSGLFLWRDENSTKTKRIVRDKLNASCAFHLNVALISQGVFSQLNLL